MGISKKSSPKKHTFGSTNPTTPFPLRRSRRLARLPISGLAPNAPNRVRIAVRVIQAGVRLRRNLTAEFEAVAEPTHPSPLTRTAIRALHDSE